MITLLELTNIDNTKFLVNQDQIITIIPTADTVANSLVIPMGTSPIGVLETIDDIKALISEVATATTSVISTVADIPVATPITLDPSPTPVV